MKSKQNPSAVMPQILFSSLFAALSGLAVTFLCTLLLSVLIEHAVIPESWTQYAYLSVIPGALLGGFLTAGRAGKKMLLYGMLGGGMFFLLLLLLSVLFLPDLAFRNRIVPALICTAAASVLGAILAPRR